MNSTLSQTASGEEMNKQLRAATVVASLAALAPLAGAQTTTRKSPQHRKPAGPSIQTQIREMRDQLQSQIDELKSKLADKDAQIQALQTSTQSVQQTTAANQAATEAVAVKVQGIGTTVEATTSSVASLQTQTASVATGIEQVRKTEEKIQKSVDEPVAIHYKGVTITPGGFIAGESIWRQRAMNSDIYTNFNATPYMNTGEAHTSEWVPSARQTRPSVLVSGKTPFGTVSGFFEADFLSAGTTSNNLQSNSYTLRVRQAWAQASFGRSKFTAGQMFTLLTENKKSADPGQEALPLTFDNNFHVGETWSRQMGYRFEESFTPKVTLAVSLENSQYQFSASNAPSNFFFGGVGVAAGLENQTANYTNQIAPDVIAKVSFDPGFGHYEIGGIARFFRDRFYPGTTAAGAQNDTRVGGGFVASARLPIAHKLDLGLHLIGGDGTGRYGASLLPDITVRPDGTLSPLRNAQGLLSLELHATKKLDLFGYAGTEYVQRTYYRNAAGTLVGYAPPTASNAGCNTEGVPTAGTGYAPGVTACVGATRNITQGSAGWVYRIYSGPAGKLQYGVAYSYLTRSGWQGVGGAPKATNNFVYTSVRYYIP